MHIMLRMSISSRLLYRFMQGEGSQVEWVGLQRLWIQIQRKERGRVHWKEVEQLVCVIQSSIRNLY